VWKWFRPSFWLTLASIIGWGWLELRLQPSVPRTLISIAFLLSVPGYVALRSLVGYRTKLTASKLATYTVGVSLVTLMILGLAANELFQATGWQQPLSLQPLTWAVGGFSLVAAIIANIRKPADLRPPAMPWKLLRSTWGYIAVAVALPILAAGGAITLNNGGSNGLALVAMGLAGVYFLAMLWRYRAVAKLYPLALYSISLSLLLSTSLRGWHITGHDVMQEYQVFELTLRHAAWSMSYYHDAYNACLSITILPTVFQRLSGLSDPFVYKFIFQLFFALIAPVIYNTLRSFTTKRTALLAAFIFITFPTFLTDMTMLNRQETALLCFALALQAGLDKSLGKRGKLLAFVFLIGMVLSHYSTSYVATSVLLIAAGLAVAVKLFRFVFRRPPLKGGFSVLPLSLILATCVLLVTWGSLLTQTSGNISRTLEGVVTGLPTLFSSGAASDPSYSRTGQSQSDDALVQQYLHTTDDVRTLTASEYYAQATKADSAVTAQKETVSPVSARLGKYLSLDTLTSFYDLIKKVYGLLIEGLVGLGVCLVVIIKRWRRKFAGQYKLLILGSLVIIGAQVVLPAALVNYGLLRVIQQGLIVLALPLVLACYWLLGLLRLRMQWRPQILGAILVFLFFVLSGFLPTLTGGYKPVLPLSNSGFYYEAYYTHASEISADTWLVQKTPEGSRVYSDEFARRKMIAYSGIFSYPTLSPGSIPKDSYVYLSDANTRLGVVPAYYNGTLVYYSVPTAFLQLNKNLVYSSGSVQIYK
jgi:uncharacterized membrane protein